jgi:hypothetical protein
VKFTGVLSLGACALLLLAGCVRGVHDDATATSEQGAVPDEVLFEQVRGLPGVVSVEGLRYQHPFGYPPAYAGTILVGQDADPLCVLDEALSVLHQGRTGVDLGVLVRTPEKQAYGLLSLVGRDGSAEHRYGPQPTEPQAEATVRPCAPPEGEVSATPTPAG